ncbi:plantaricin C family lantibiotic [Pontibacillus salicampi]|uniref:Plantaricin C family lantibiotic n=1 Tax=Pontibacillus salicampi TaxID=1449801 RepID=A0ABV6LMH0_9BACI
MKEQLYASAGNIEMELEEISLKSVSGGAAADPQGISQDNDGKHCTITWECSICPTHTCWC